MEQKLTQVAWAEFIGTFFYVFLGCGAIVAGQEVPRIGLLGTALAFGLAAAAVITAISAVSGGHINPAVSLGLWASKRLPASKLPVYLIAQILGAIAGALVLRAVLPEVYWAEVDLGATVLGPGVTLLAAVAIEALLTFVLMLVVLGSGSDPSQERAIRIAGVPVGLAIVACIVMGGAFTGGSMNPARSIGPALVSMDLTDLWVYLVGPIAGGLAAGLMHSKVLAPSARSSAKDDSLIADSGTLDS